MRNSFFGVLRAAPPSPPAGLVYRLRHWPEHVPASLYTAEVLRTLSVMSGHPVSRDWLLRHSSIKPNVLDALLQLLVAHGDLEVIDPSKFGAAP